jgi:glycosyltransferase involved in cell wall biosynthesis
MHQIAVLIPTYKRPHKLENLITNFNQTTKQASLYFVITPEDKETKQLLDDLEQNYFIVEGEYVRAINTAFNLTDEPFIFCGADDIEFTQDWDKKLLESINGVGVTGGIDDWQISKSGVHTSHPLIRRSYILEQGGALGYPGLVYNPNNEHYQVDIELEQLSWSRGQIRINKDCIIHHNHYVNHKAKNDSTYSRSRKTLDKDTENYNNNKIKYEYWDTCLLHQGMAKKVSTLKKLSVVMPIWNCEDYSRKTLASLMENTQHPYELILIDDASTEHNGEKLLAELKEIACKKFLTVKTVANSKQVYCNANWNKGVELATGDYIAIINSDIEFLTKDWDDYLIECVDMGYELVNPFQVDKVYPHPYMKPPHEDAIYHLNIRGACFMVSKQFATIAFPIPSNLVHWCGDNWISSKAKTYTYDIRVVIRHHISKSGAKVNLKIFWNMVYKDVLEWITMSGSKEMDAVLQNCQNQLKILGEL